MAINSRFNNPTVPTCQWVIISKETRCDKNCMIQDDVFSSHQGTRVYTYNPYCDLHALANKINNE